MLVEQTVDVINTADFGSLAVYVAKRIGHHVYAIYSYRACGTFLVTSHVKQESDDR